MFENKLINGVYASRYIASWLRSGGELRYDSNRNFYKWLLSIGLTKDEAQYIKRLAENGKLELEIQAKQFISKLLPDDEEEL